MKLYGEVIKSDALNRATSVNKRAEIAGVAVTVQLRDGPNSSLNVGTLEMNLTLPMSRHYPIGRQVELTVRPRKDKP